MLQEVLGDFLSAEGTALAVPGGAFHTQKTEDVAAWEAYRVDAALQANGTLRGDGAGRVCGTSISPSLN